MNKDGIKLNSPLNGDDIKKLKAGDAVLLSGTVYTARDAAHKRLHELLEAGKPLPFDINGQTIFYVGPCLKEGKIVSAGPTTSARMDAYAPELYSAGLAATIGKGERSDSVYAAIKNNSSVYFAAIGGAGAIYAQSIISVEPVAYPELGTEAINRLTVKDMPLIVAIDSEGDSIYRR